MPGENSDSAGRVGSRAWIIPRSTVLHMAKLAQGFHAAPFVLRSPAPFCDRRHAELRNDLRNG